MIGFCLMAVETRIICLAAVEFDRHDIQATSVVHTASVLVYLDASYRNS